MHLDGPARRGGGAEALPTVVAAEHPGRGQSRGTNRTPVWFYGRREYRTQRDAATVVKSTGGEDAVACRRVPSPGRSARIGAPARPRRGPGRLCEHPGRDGPRRRPGGRGGRRLDQRPGPSTVWGAGGERVRGVQ